VATFRFAIHLVSFEPLETSFFRLTCPTLAPRVTDALHINRVVIAWVIAPCSVTSTVQWFSHGFDSPPSVVGCLRAPQEASPRGRAHRELSGLSKLLHRAGGQPNIHRSPPDGVLSSPIFRCCRHPADLFLSPLFPHSSLTLAVTPRRMWADQKSNLLLSSW
jgi:hypothetical protein